MGTSNPPKSDQSGTSKTKYLHEMSVEINLT